MVDIFFMAINSYYEFKYDFVIMNSYMLHFMTYEFRYEPVYMKKTVKSYDMKSAGTKVLGQLPEDSNLPKLQACLLFRVIAAKGRSPTGRGSPLPA